MHNAPIAPSATRGNSRRFCSSLPKSISGLVAWKLVAQMMPVEAQACEIGISRRDYWRELEVGEVAIDSALQIMDTARDWLSLTGMRQAA